MKTLLRGVLVLGLSMLLVGGVAADEKKEDKDKKEKKDKEKKDKDFMLPDFDKLLEQLGGGLNDEQMKELRERMKEMRERMQQLQKGRGLPGGGMLFPPIPGMGGLGERRALPSAQEGRLGATLRQPSAAMIDQLDLPKNQGLVLEEVGPNSAAAKAGMKANDILLEVNGKAVSSKKAEFDKVLAEVKADKAVDAVVMRKGKKETIKGLKLPEAKAVKPQPGLFPGGFPRLPGGLGLGGGNTSGTVITRTNDEFTATHKADGVTFTVKGKVDQGKAEPSEIVIESDGKSTTYESVDKVPAEHQEKVKKLVEMSAGKVRQPRR